MQVGYKEYKKGNNSGRLMENMEWLVIQVGYDKCGNEEYFRLADEDK